MEIQQLVEKWTKEMADIKSHIKKHEDTFGHPAVTSRERLEAISDMLADIKQLKISCNPPVMRSLPTLEEAYSAGVSEGMDRTGNFEWGIKRRDIEYAEWLRGEVGNDA